MASGPILVKDIFNLSSHQIAPDRINPNTSVLSSDTYLCVTNGDHVLIVELRGGSSTLRFPNAGAEAAIMHPSKPVIALRAPGFIQLFNITTKERIPQDITCSEKVEFWTWIDENVLAVVTSNSVLHLDVGSGSQSKVFDIPQIGGFQVLSYTASADRQHCALYVVTQVDGRVQGKVVFYSNGRGVNALDGYCSCIAQINNSPHLIFGQKDGSNYRLTIASIANQTKKAVDVQLDSPDSIPLRLVYSKRFSSIFVLTNTGFLYAIEVETATFYHQGKVCGSQAVSCQLGADGSVVCCLKEGKVIRIVPDLNTIVDYVNSRSASAAQRIALAANIRVSDEMLLSTFDQYLRSGSYREAASMASQAKGEPLRGLPTIQKLQRLPSPGAGQPSPLLTYLLQLIQLTQLDEQESIELCAQVVQMQKSQLLEGWIQEEKITVSEFLGDRLKALSAPSKLVAAIYLRAGSHVKVCASFAEVGEFKSVSDYCQHVGIQPDWIQILSVCSSIETTDIKGVVEYLANNGSPLVDPRQAIQVLNQNKRTTESIRFLLKCLPGDRVEDNELQTILFELALTYQPKMAEELFARECFSYYDREKIAGLCERAGNFQRALEHYDNDLESIKRCIVYTQSISPDFLVSYFGNLKDEWAIECLKELLVRNPQAHVQIVVQIASVYYERLGIDAILNLFREQNSQGAIYYFLANVVATCTDPDIHFRYIEAAANMKEWGEVERWCEQSEYLQKERVRDYLMQFEEEEVQVPVIVLCNRFEFISELTRYLYNRNQLNKIETYVTKFNTSMAGRVVGSLIDIEAPNDFIMKLITAVQHTASIRDLIAETMKRDKLLLLQSILEAREATGSKDPDTNNGIVLLRYTLGQSPEVFLKENMYYDPHFVGTQLANRDPRLACIAFAKGNCDDELVKLTNEHQLYKEQARYLVSRQDPDLWAKVLEEDNPHLSSVVSAVNTTALPECTDPNKVSVTIKAFIKADIKGQLVTLLEKLVLENPKFNGNPSLQNLLIMSAADEQEHRPRVMSYIQSLDKFTWDQVAPKLIERELYDEAIAVYKKFKQPVDAVRVMIEHKKDLQAALDWAQHCNEKLVWGELGRAYLNESMAGEAIDAFIKAEDCKEYKRVIELASSLDQYKPLVQFLELARKVHNRDPMIESELCFAYAKCDMLAELEALVTAPNSADVEKVATRCFDAELYKAAKILFTSIKNYEMLAETLIKLGDLEGAIEAAIKASSTKTWKSVNRACVLAGRFDLAEIAGLRIVVEADQVSDIVDFYEELGHFEQIIGLLEKALTHERAHGGIFTHLAILYARHQPDKCMGHLKQYHQRMSLFKVIKELQELHMWKELVFSHDKYGEHDEAVTVVMKHPAACYDHSEFRELVTPVSNVDILYRSVEFYVEFDPLKTVDHLDVIGSRLDPSRLVHIFRQKDNLQLIKPYLRKIQSVNVQDVNEALNQMYIDDGDYKSLRESIDSYTLYDQVALARKLEKHECLEFRRVSSYIFANVGRWDESIEISKRDHYYRDAIETASRSRQPEIVERLVGFFMENNLLECFAAATYVCYDLIPPDLVLELSWRNKCYDFAMPFLIQTMREQSQTIAKLKSDVESLTGSVTETKAVVESVKSVANPTFDGFGPQPQALSQAGAIFAPPGTTDPYGQRPMYSSQGGFATPMPFAASQGGFPAFGGPGQHGRNAGPFNPQFPSNF